MRFEDTVDELMKNYDVQIWQRGATPEMYKAALLAAHYDEISHYEIRGGQIVYVYEDGSDIPIEQRYRAGITNVQDDPDIDIPESTGGD